jgi:carbamoyl-phosphate synthase large subunit
MTMKATKKFTLMISSVGRRAQLVDCFRRSARELNLKLTVVGIDTAPELSPASHLVDHCFKVPRCTDPDFVPAVLRICRSQEVKLIIPTIDPELPVYAESQNLFAAAGTMVLVSSPETIRIAADKALTNAWFAGNGLPTVRQAKVADVRSNQDGWVFPVVVKPRRGSASVGVHRVTSPHALASMMSGDDLVVEELAVGVEHTTNVFVDSEGRCLCAIPHRRLEIRGGEVSKGITIKNVTLMELARRAAERLPGARGPLNVQAFVSEAGEIRFTEINARFGGGFPLAYQAGANFCRWIFEDMLGLPSTASFDGWKENLLMLRFDSAVFVERAAWV